LEAALQITVSGVFIGLEYALAAVGMTVIFAAGRVLNLTQGAFFALGAFAGYQATALGYQALAGAAPAAAAGFLLGAAVERTFVRPTRASPLAAAVALFALAILAEEAFLLAWGPSAHSVPLRLPPLLIGRIVVSVEQVAAVVIAVAVIAAAAVGLRTHIGLALRAAAADPEIAAVAGIDVARLRTVAFGAGCAMAALAGAFLSPQLTVAPAMGRLPLVTLLAIVFAAGPGSLWASTAASVGVGLLTTSAGFYLTPDWSSMLILFILIALLVWRGDWPCRAEGR
jgi:branched-chain amino acid transport system permease protein